MARSVWKGPFVEESLIKKEGSNCYATLKELPSKSNTK